ncbi:predicted protein [Chaetomium globosum CBS 148.51]|uniref:Uncharacterized protein n=1 Tax=Chaetomium globosum (strain ATCC 6205 / CBS 148.51 / DSM 1962 / NBRC 6347 / NRRL 1970) TaxID=306901 RepID=Q2H0A3_CHAGB|nr:uncharacterized protein CHGG_04793 [Chaetomium globosum CBS 148.51]EAQ88174.1 predicted protein [Chaetomium globosum CBS 148.51]
MTRQYFCWKVSLSFRCGCTELAPIVHRCPPDREGCNSWLTHKRTDKYCETHRASWGLAQSSDGGSRSPSPSPSPFTGLSGSAWEGGEGLSVGVSAGQGQGQGQGEGEDGLRRRGSPVAEGVDGGEAGAAVSGRRVVGYY